MMYILLMSVGRPIFSPGGDGIWQYRPSTFRRDINCSTQWNLRIDDISRSGLWSDSTERPGAYEVRDSPITRRRRLVHHWEWTDLPLRDSSDVRPFEWRLSAIRKINPPFLRPFPTARWPFPHHAHGVMNLHSGTRLLLQLRKRTRPARFLSISSSSKTVARRRAAKSRCWVFDMDFRKVFAVSGSELWGIHSIVEDLIIAPVGEF